MRWLMVAGALGNALTSLVFIFVAGEEAPPDWLVDTAELVAVPSQVLFTIGFTAAAIRLGGLKFGRIFFLMMRRPPRSTR